MKDTEFIIPVVAGIGNGLLAVPMIRLLKKITPDSKITIVARNSAMAEVFRRLEEVERVTLIKPGLVGMLKALAYIYYQHAGVFLVPFPSNRWQYSLLAALSGAKRKILHSYPKGRLRSLSFLPAERVPARQGLHDVQQNMLLLTKLGAEEGDALDSREGPIFPLNETDRKRAGQLLSGAGYDSELKPIIVHAGSAQTVLAEAKRWPAERYGSLVRALEKEFGPRVIMVEGPDETGVGEEILRQSHPCRPRIIQLLSGLGDAAALLEKSKFYVGSDSGLAHLAAAVGTPAVTLFGPGDPERVCPFGQRHLVVQPEKKDCAPCNSYPWHTPYPKVGCSTPACMGAISVEAVMARVRIAATESRGN